MANWRFPFFINGTDGFGFAHEFFQALSTASGIDSSARRLSSRRESGMKVACVLRRNDSVASERGGGVLIFSDPRARVVTGGGANASSIVRGPWGRMIGTRAMALWPVRTGTIGRSGRRVSAGPLRPALDPLNGSRTTRSMELGLVNRPAMSRISHPEFQTARPDSLPVPNRVGCRCLRQRSRRPRRTDADDVGLAGRPRSPSHGTEQSVLPRATAPRPRS